jgi:NADH-quinone oxidoreductase subunit M
MNYEAWVLDGLLALPLVAGLVVLLRPEREAKWVAVVAATAEFLLSVPLWWVFEPGTAAMQFEVARPWIPGWGVWFRLGLDGISLFMVLLTTFTMPLAVLGSWNYIKERQRGYYALLLVLTTGMLGVFVALDLFVFYVFWEIMLIPMYFIIGVWGGPRRLYAAIKFFVFTFVGSLLMLVAILTINYQVGRATGTYSFAYDHILANIAVTYRGAFWLFGAFFLAFAIKVPLFPFHTWLPDAHVEAPTAGSVILAGILLKMGTYGFLRFALPFFPQVVLDPAVVNVVVILAVVGIIYGGLVAMVQPDFKKLVAYSSVAHLGFVMLGIWAVTVQSVEGAIIIMISHGVSTGALFFLAGGPDAGDGADHRGLVLRGVAGDQRLHRGVPGARGIVRRLSVGRSDRSDRRHRRGHVPVAGPAADHLQQARQARERGDA